MRVAIYFTPPADAELTRLAVGWLGRDAFGGCATRRANAAIDPIVAEPARYGFHATMKAPFRLRDGLRIDALDAHLAGFCAARAPIVVRQLALRRIDAFLALVPAEQSAELTQLAGAVVREFEVFRAALDAREIARRGPERLSERQRAHLADWGYPYVFDEFRFHMTLTGRLAEPGAAAVEAEVARRFARVLGHPLPIDGLALFVEPEPGAPFEVRSRHSFASR